MASLAERNGSYRVTFVWNGKRETFTIGRVTLEEAEAKSSHVDYLLMRFKQGLTLLPPGIGIVDYIEHDGKPPQVQHAETAKLTLAALCDHYIAVHEGSLEANTMDSIRLHFKHLKQHLGKDFPIADLTLADLQGYVQKRAKAKGIHGRLLSPATLKKEIISLRTTWNWGKKMKLLKEPFPYHGLRYPKSTEKPPFQTRAEIERRIAGSKLSAAEIADLYDSMYLTVDEIAEMLEHVKSKAIQPWVYPLLCFAAHTGARRSEIIRLGVTDIDLAAKVVTISEKKRVKGTNTTRRIPLSPFLIDVLNDWLAIHPGGQFLFCQQAVVGHSKNRSATTGHKTQRLRPTGGKARAAMVKTRDHQESAPLTRNEIRDHVKRVLKDSKWSVMKGIHCCRHAFISACATRGIDQRYIDEWVGHQTDEQRKRYRHLAPSSQQEALARVFG